MVVDVSDLIVDVSSGNVGRNLDPEERLRTVDVIRKLSIIHDEVLERMCDPETRARAYRAIVGENRVVIEKLRQEAVSGEVSKLEVIKRAVGDGRVLYPCCGNDYVPGMVFDDIVYLDAKNVEQSASSIVMALKQEIPFSDGAFDVVYVKGMGVDITGSIADFLEDEKLFCDEVGRVLRGDGTVIFTNPGYQDADTDEDTSAHFLDMGYGCRELTLPDPLMAHDVSMQQLCQLTGITGYLITEPVKILRR